MGDRHCARSAIKRMLWIVMIGTTMLALLAGCGNSESSVDAAATATTRFSTGMEGLQGGVERGMPPTVTMTDGKQFEPARVTVRAGTPVAWRNNSSESHTVTADPAQARTAANVQLPPGAEPFGSENLPAGQLFTHQFTIVGEYRYVCRIHEDSGMMGIVIVE